MNNSILTRALAGIALAAGLTVVPTITEAAGADQIDGIAYPDLADDCDHVAAGVEPPAYALVMTGDLDGCLYGYIDEAKVTPSGVTQLRGREVFVSGADGGDRFGTGYLIISKYDETGQVWGRCHHPIANGEGAYVGVRGQLNFRDTIVDGVAVEYPYWGHVQLD